MKTITDIERSLNDTIADNIADNIDSKENIDVVDIQNKKNEEFKVLTKNQGNLEFLKIAELSRELTDLDCGIITTKISKDDSKSIPIVGSDKNAGITIRDGRFKDRFVNEEGEKISKSHPSESKYSWIAQMAITAKGVQDLLNNAKYEVLIDDKTVSNKFQRHLEAIDRAQNPEEYKKITLNFNNQLKNYVKEQKLGFSYSVGSNLESLPFTLKSNKDIVNAIDSARHFAQLKMEHTHNITIGTGKKNDILIQTNLIVNSKPSKESIKKWGQNLNTTVQRVLFQKNESLITSGEKVISSKFKNLMQYPGIANGFMSFNHIKSGEEELKQMGKPNLRTAALANTKGDSAYENTKKVVEDIAEIDKKFNAKSKGVVVLNLNNTVWWDRKEKKIRDNTERACGEVSGAEYKNVPINNSNTWHIIKGWFGGGDKKEEKFQKIIDIILDAESNNKTLLIQCKSGKDRTGYAQILKNCMDYQKKIDPNAQKTELLEKIIHDKLFEDYTKDNVQEYQAGGVGASVGVNAIKSGGYTMTGGKPFLNKIGGGIIFKTNELQKLNNFQAKDNEEYVESIINRVDITQQQDITNPKNQESPSQQQQKREIPQDVKAAAAAIEGLGNIQPKQPNQNTTIAITNDPEAKKNQR